MNSLFWNVQGLGNPGTKRALQSHSLKYKPDFIFLSETKLKRSAAQRVRVLLGYDNCFAVECVGRNGGLLLLWREPISFTLCSYSQYHIEGWVIDEEECENRIRSSWDSCMDEGVSMLLESLRRCRGSLGAWGREWRSGLKKKIEK